jgi:hypothetical protein
MTDSEPLTPEDRIEAARIFLTKLSALGWAIGFAPDGALQIVIGDDWPGGVPQHVILSAIRSFEWEYAVLLGVPADAIH